MAFVKAEAVDCAGVVWVVFRGRRTPPHATLGPLHALSSPLPPPEQRTHHIFTT